MIISPCSTIPTTLTIIISTRPFYIYFLEFSKITHFGFERLLYLNINFATFTWQCSHAQYCNRIWPKVQTGLLSNSSTSKLKKRASSRLLAQNRVSQVLWDPIKTVHLQGFWQKTVYLKCFGIQFKTVHLQGPHSSRPCISRPCCIFFIWGRSSNLIGPAKGFLRLLRNFY